MTICPKKLAKRLEKLGLSHSQAIEESWKAKIELEKLKVKKKKETNWHVANVDDPRRAKEEGLMEGNKKYGGGQWDQKTEDCIQSLLASGKEKSSAVPICRSKNKDA